MQVVRGYVHDLVIRRADGQGCDEGGAGISNGAPIRQYLRRGPGSIGGEEDLPGVPGCQYGVVVGGRDEAGRAVRAPQAREGGPGGAIIHYYPVVLQSSHIDIGGEAIANGRIELDRLQAVVDLGETTASVCALVDAAVTGDINIIVIGRIKPDVMYVGMDISRDLGRAEASEVIGIDAYAREDQLVGTGGIDGDCMGAPVLPLTMGGIR